MLSNVRYLRRCHWSKRAFSASSEADWDERVVYSSLREVVGKGRSLQKAIYHRNLIRQNEATRRKIEMNDYNNVPVALKYAFEGVGVTQRDDSEEGEHVVGDLQAEETDPEESIQMPYGIYDELHKAPEEDPEFDLFDPNSDRLKSENLLKEDELFRFGTPNPSVPPSRVPCGGCGAHLHCHDTKMPGFIPSELFQDRLPTVCQRCYILKRYNVALKLNVSPEDYPKTIQHIRDEENVLIVLVVDMADYPSSIWPEILNIIGPEKPVILVGNKIDLLPKDSDNYLHHLERCMVREFQKKCSQSGVDANVVDKILVSAMTGYNVETLIDKVFQNIFNAHRVAKRTGNRQPPKKIYMIGSTNVGKSSLFNMLMDSDLCKTQAYDKVEKASVTPVPGTTLNLLKFPVVRPDPSRMNERISRLARDASVLSQIERHRLQELIRTKDAKLSSPVGIVGRTFGQDKSPSNIMDFSFSNNNHLDRMIPKRLNPKDPDFSDGRWFYDTPGTVSEDQIINLLTQEELQVILPEHTIQPRTFLIRLGESILLGGIGRLDVITAKDISKFRHPLRITVFCSSALPIHILETSFVEEFIENNLLQLKVPSSNPSRLAKLPAMDSKDFVVDSSNGEATVDIILSSIGWICCFPKNRYVFGLRAWTPGGKGLTSRYPAFLPFASLLKGDRINGTPTYKNPGIFLPE